MSPATGHLLTALATLGRMAAANEIGMVTSTPDGVRDANDAFLRLTGYTRADLEAGRVHWRVLTAPEWTSLDDSAVDQLRETGSYGPHLKEYRRRDGTRLMVEVTGVLVSHEPVSWVTFVRDLAAQPAGERLTDSAERLAGLAAELARDVAVTDVARTLTRHVRQAMGAIGATIMEVDLAGRSMSPVLTDEIPAPIARTYAAFDLQLDAPSTRAWRARQMGFYPDPETIDKTFPHLAEVRADSAVRSCMAVPLVAGDEITGVLTVYWSTPRELSAAERSFTDTVAGYAAQALERARLYEAEHAAAHQLQQALLPEIPAELPGVSIGALYRPAEKSHDVGGDWFDAFELPGGKIGCAVGDVVGHDLAAAAAMGRLQLLLRYTALRGAGHASVLDALDQACPDLTGTDLATVAYAEYDPAGPDGPTLTYACAGHPPPLLSVGSTVRYLDGGRSRALGFRGPRTQARITVPLRSRLVLYTDGLIERRRQPLDTGFEQLARAVGELPAGDPSASCDRLLSVMTGGETLADDVAVACIDLNGPGAGS